MDNTKKVFDKILGNFFGTYLHLRKNEQIKNKSVKLPEFNKVYLNNLKKYYEIAGDEADVDKDDESEADD